MRSAEAAWVAAGQVARQGPPKRRFGHSSLASMYNDGTSMSVRSVEPESLAPVAAGCGAGWWAGGIAMGAAGAAGLAVFAWMLRRAKKGAVVPGPAGPVNVYDRPPPTQPGEPAVANPFAVLPDTRLVILRGLPVQDRFYRLSTSPFTVGADATAHLVLDSPRVSGHHATLELLDDGTVYLIDASRNGTYVDGTRVPQGARVRVNHGQRIEFSRDIEVRLEQPSHDRGAGRVVAEPAAVAEPAVVEAGAVLQAEPSPARKAETVVAPPKAWRGDR